MSNRIYRQLMLVLMGALLVALGYIAGMNRPVTLLVAQGTQPVLTEAETRLADIYTRVSPSIVSIVISEPFDGELTEISGGSGFVIDKAGHIITNFHVVHGVSNQGRIEVNFIDGTIVRAEVVGEDPTSDIAVIQVDVPEARLFPVTFADSDHLVIGQTTVALGSPFGQRWTMTTGIISALDRTIDGLNMNQIGAVIQTDAAINPGNSGGPLLNLNGEVLGVNSQIISEERLNSGIAFAVPGNLVQRVATDLITTGKVEYAYLGVTGTNITLALMEELNLPDNTQGVLVERLSQLRGESPAEDAKLQVNDIITAVDDTPIYNFGMLIAHLSIRTRPGQTITVTVLRDGQTLELPVTLGTR